MILDFGDIDFIIYIIICVCLIAFSWYRLSKQDLSTIRRARRICFILLGLLGLGLIMLKPSYSISKQKSTASISSGKNIQANQYSSVHSILSSQAIQHDSVVFDPSALTIEDLELDRSIHLIPKLDTNLWGLSDLFIPNRIVELEKWNLSGHIERTSSAYIKDPITSVIYTAQLNSTDFELSTIAPIAGDYIYTLYLINGQSDTINYDISIHVEQSEPWQILAITSYPTFEVNTLKNYWTTKGNGFFWKTAVSTGRYRETSTNSPIKRVDEITTAILDQLDFLLIDISSWNQLSNSERSRINRRIASEGIGLIIIPNEVGQRAQQVTHPDIIEYNEGTSDKPNSYFSFANGWKSLSDNGTLLAKYQDYGLGVRMILSQDQTFRYVLKNNERNFNGIWNKILSTAYNKFQTHSKLISSKWIWAGEKTRIQLISETPIVDRILLNDSTTVNAIKDPLIENSYELTLWPKLGYNTITFNGEQLKFFAYNPSNYPLVKFQEFKEVQLNLPPSTIANSYLERILLSPMYGFMILLLGIGLLWLDERLY